MNNIEINQLKRDIKEYLGYSDEQVRNIGVLSDQRLHAMKRDIEKVKAKRQNTTGDRYARNLIKKRVNEIFKKHPKLKEKTIIGRGLSPAPANPHGNKPFTINQGPAKKIEYEGDKPKILLICDVKGWAWWNKSLYLKDHLADEFDIDVVHVLGDGCTPANRIDQMKYDLYFTYGFLI